MNRRRPAGGATAQASPNRRPPAVAATGRLQFWRGRIRRADQIGISSGESASGGSIQLRERLAEDAMILARLDCRYAKGPDGTGGVGRRLGRSQHAGNFRGQRHDRAPGWRGDPLAPETILPRLGGNFRVGQDKVHFRQPAHIGAMQFRGTGTRILRELDRQRVMENRRHPHPVAARIRGEPRDAIAPVHQFGQQQPGAGQARRMRGMTMQGNARIRATGKPAWKGANPFAGGQRRRVAQGLRRQAQRIFLRKEMQAVSVSIPKRHARTLGLPPGQFPYQRTHRCRDARTRGIPGGVARHHVNMGRARHSKKNGSGAAGRPEGRATMPSTAWRSRPALYCHGCQKCFLM